MKNQPSIQLFEKKLAFYPVSSSEIFQEITLEWSINQPSITNNDEDGNTQYGSSATSLQKEMCQKTNKTLMDMWNNNIKKLKWD